MLTKEEIEIEGLKYVKIAYYWNAPERVMSLSFSKGNHWIAYNQETTIMTIVPIDPVKEDPYWEQVRFIGKIANLDDFRTILRILEI